MLINNVIILLSEKIYKLGMRNNMAKRPRKFSVKVKYYQLLVLGALIVFAAVSCRASGQNAEATPELELTEAAVSAADTSRVTQAVEIAADEAEPEQVDQCLVCHTDQQALMDTADPVIVIESENSGEG
jgi:hypothetical protein